jgi:hypothetical protein
MVYYLGRDVATYIAAEGNRSVFVSTGNQIATSDGGSDYQFAVGRNDAMNAAGKVSDLTGVDVGLGATDEDVAYIGQRTALKAEIKKETTVSLTRKKSDGAWSTIWNGDGYNMGRWGINDAAITAGVASNTHDGLIKPDVEWGYRIHVQLKASTEILCIQNCTVTSYSVTVNPDGITEETMEFTSHVTPRIRTAAYTDISVSTEL